jgi:heme-degrading monooxygenase HmoA
MTFARNVHFTVKDGKAEEFNRLMHTEVLPRLKGQRGFRQELTIFRNDAGMSISVWDSRASAEAYDAKIYPEVLEKLDAVLEGTPRVDTYDTVVTTSR